MVEFHLLSSPDAHDFVEKQQEKTVKLGCSGLKPSKTLFSLKNCFLLSVRANAAKFGENYIFYKKMKNLLHEYGAWF